MIEREHDGYWVEMSDEEPVAYDRDVRSFTPPDRSDTSARGEADSLVNIPPSREMVPSEDLTVRVMQLEAITKDLWAKLKAIEAKVL